MRLHDEIALVTGATRGIGKAIASALAGDGARVIGTATTEAGSAQIGADLGQAAAPCAGKVLDVRDGDAVAALLEEVAREFGPVSILVNNAGITRDNLLMRMKESEWDEIIDTNLKSVFRLSKACLRGMVKARHGRIINISSVVAASGNAGQANYAAAKAGIIGFSKSLAREVASRNVTVNAIAPGFIETDMTGELADEQRTALLAQIPLQRLGEPADVAGAVLYLAGPQGAYVTGQTLHINGGMYMP